MQILQDGNVQIRNKKTGEVKVVSPGELPNYGISYSTYQGELKAYKEAVLGEVAPTSETATAEKSSEETKNSALGLINDLLNRDTGAVTGLINPFKPAQTNYTKNIVEQLKGTLSLEKRKMLKGQGQISDKEMAILESAVSALGEKTKAGNYKLSNEDFKTELTRIQAALQNKEIPTAAEKSKYSGSEFVKNAGADATSILSGLLNLPSTLRQAGKEGVQEVLKDPTSFITTDPITTLLKTPTARNMGKGLVDEYAELLSNPVETAYKKPVSTVLDILPFIKGAQTLSKASKAGKATELAKAGEVAKTADVAGDVSKTTQFIQESAPGINKIFGKVKGISPRSLLTKAKTESYKLYDTVKPDTNVIKNAAEEFVKKYPTAQATYDKYKTAIESSNTVEKLDKSLGEWGDAFNKNKEIKPGISNDFIGTLYKAGREELTKKAPKVAEVKSLMGEWIDVEKAGGKALWKAVLAKLLLGK